MKKGVSRLQKMTDGFAVAEEGTPFSRSDGRRSFRPCERLSLARRWWITGVAAVFYFFATAASAATFLLDSGESLEGEVIHATRNTVMVRKTIGGIRQLSLGEVEAVEITTRDGDIVTGALLSWQEGVYEVDAGERRIRLEDGRIVGEDEPKVPMLIISTAEAIEGATEMIFKIDLSVPTRRSIFLVYGTFDRTAKAGEDYREERGSLELAPGDKSAVLRILLIDDDVAEGDESFEVFVSADKELATIENNRVVGTILNDDE